MYPKEKCVKDKAIQGFILRVVIPLGMFSLLLRILKVYGPSNLCYGYHTNV